MFLHKSKKKSKIFSHLEKFAENKIQKYKTRKSQKDFLFHKIFRKDIKIWKIENYKNMDF